MHPQGERVEKGKKTEREEEKWLGERLQPHSAKATANIKDAKAMLRRKSIITESACVVLLFTFELSDGEWAEIGLDALRRLTLLHAIRDRDLDLRRTIMSAVEESLMVCNT